MKVKTVAWERFEKVERDAKEALRLASHHDPDHERRFKELYNRIAVIDRQLQRLCAPEYRVVRKGKKKAR